jgi:hypothetical protein
MSNDTNNEAAKPKAAPERKNGSVKYAGADGKLTDKAPKSKAHKRRSLEGKVAKPPAK